VERGGRSSGIERPVPANGVPGGEHLDVDASGAQLVERSRIGLHAAVRAGAEDQPPRQLVEHVVEILEHEPVPVPAPPVFLDTLGKDDDVAGVLLTIDDDVPEPVVLDARHGGIMPQPARA
jgi:hypothetical protein